MKKEVKRIQYDIPSFSLKSSLLILVTATFFAFIVPWLFSLLHISNILISVVVPSFMVALVSAYTVNFIDSDRGLGKRFYLVFVSVLLGLLVLMYFWTKGI